MKIRIILTALVLLFAAQISWADWPQFRGPDRDGISKETGLLKAWKEGGPPLAWRVEGIGTGFSAPSIAGGKIFGMSNRGNNEVVWALSEKDGKELWATPLGAAVQGGMRQGREGTGCTPTVDGDRIYVLGAGGALACLQIKDGKIVWQRSLIDDFGGRLPTWRYNESPLVDGSKVICTPGAADATLVALDKMTGKLIWKSKAPDGGGNTTGGNATGRGSRERRQMLQAASAPAAAAAQPKVVIPAGSTWKYLDTGAAPGPDWTKPDFKDDAWAEGPAQLGYGDGDEKTKLNDTRDNYPTYYFRRKFDVKDPGKLKPLVLRILRDDGAIVYINGVEVLRDNMPSGSVSRGTFSAEVTPVEDGFYVHDLAASKLAAGINVIAVEVHQASATSSDVSFDLELREKIPGKDVLGAPPQQRRTGSGRGSFGRGGSRRGGSGAGYASAIAIDFEGQRQYVQLTATTLMGVAASDGKFLWKYDKAANSRRINCATPIHVDGFVFGASAYDNGGGLVKLSKSADGAIKAEEVYFTEMMQNHHGGMVVHDGCLYGANGGNSGGYLVCLDFKTGEVLWRARREAPKGSLTLADGRIYWRTERHGTVILIEPSREKFIERGRFEQPDRTRTTAWSYPVICNGKLYIRDQDLLLCYDVKAR